MNAKKENENLEAQATAEEQTLTVVVDSVAISVTPGLTCQPKDDTIVWQKENGTNPAFTFDLHPGNKDKYVKLDIIGSVSLGSKQVGDLKLPLIGYVVRNLAGEIEVFPSWLLTIKKSV
jgi:hypothetical protein